MITILSTLVCLLWFRVRSRASLELELIGLRHQVIVLRRQRPRRLRLFLNRPSVLGLALPGATSTPRYLGTRQTGDRDRMASQGLPHLLAMAITPFGTIQDECRNPRPDPPDERCQPSLGRASHPWRIAQARRGYQPGHG